MQINIAARHGHLSSKTQAKISDKVERVRKFYDRVNSIQVTVDLEHADHPQVELIVSAEHHEDFVANDSSESLLAALDSVIHKVETQLRKHKDKTTDHRVTGHKHIDVPEPTNE